MRILLDEDYPIQLYRRLQEMGYARAGRRRRRHAGHDILDLGRPLDADSP